MSPRPRKAGLSAKDICQIISECKKSRVKSIQLGELTASFDVESKTLPPRVVRMPKSGIAGDAEERPGVIEPDKAVLENMEKEVKQAQLDQMCIEDPVKFEQTMIEDEEI